MGEVCTDSSVHLDVPESLGTAKHDDPEAVAVVDDEEKEKKEQQKSVPFWKLFAFADSLDVLLMVAGSVGAVVNGLCLPAMTLLFGQLINAFGSNQENTKEIVNTVGTIALRFVYVGIVSAVSSYFEVMCWITTGERQSARIRTLYLKQILRQDVTFFDTETSTGEVIARMSGDTALVQEAVGEKVGKFIQLFTTFVGGYAVAFVRLWKLTLVLMSVAPVLVIAGGIMATAISKLASRGQESYAGAGNVVEQAIGAIRTVASFTGEKKAVDEYDKSLVLAESAGIQQGAASGVGFGFMIGVMFSSYSLALWYGGTLILHEGATGGAVINVIFAVLTGGMSLGQTSPCLSAFAAGRASAYTMFQVINRVPEIDIADMNGITPDSCKGDIELRKVDFHYPTRADVPIFINFNLCISSGETVALVGESGSGKSTVVSLIERFYDPQSGEILLDGLNIKSLQLKWLRQQIGLVSQEPVLFGTSIKENIAYGKENATVAEIGAAAALANASKFIADIPKGYETLVGERGIQLSGGQKQRVAIARAILKNPRILLLDEATSALDAESERLVQDALDKVMVNRTTVVIAHRLSTIRNAHVIAVVQRGAIVETGTHDELVSNPEGAYSQLIRLQEIYKGNEHTLEDASVSSRSIGGKGKSGSFKRTDSLKSGSLSRRSLSTSGSLKGPGLGEISSADPMPQSHWWKKNKDVKHSADDVEAGHRHPAEANVSIFRLASLNKPEFPLFILGSLAAAAGGLTFPVFGLLLSSVINAFFETAHKLRKDTNFWALMFLVMGVGVFVVTPIQYWSFSVIGNKLVRRIRRLTFSAILRQEIAWFDDESNSSGAVGARLSGDAAYVKSLVADSLSLVVQNVSTIVAGLAIAFSASWQLTLLVLATVPLMGLHGFFNMKFLQGFSSDAKEKYEQASSVANDAVSSIRTVASFCAEDKILALYERKVAVPVKLGIRQGFISGTALSFSNLVMFCCYALCFWVGAKLVDNGTTTFKSVFRVFFAVTIGAVGVTQSASLGPDLTKAKTSVQSIFSIMDRKSSIDPLETRGTKLEDMKGDIQLQHVSFSYPTRPELQIFQDFNLNVPAGKTVAIVGESGSGKSTVISLIERFYDPQSGSVCVGGVDIRTLELRWLRQQIGLVSQEPNLFNESISWNITYGHDDNPPQDQIQSAAESANAHKFISELPIGYDTKVGERGIQLSGGQKQRVAIARAILKNPKILLLDEATSALDAESEHVVQEALDRIMVNRTTVVVAHRLSTIRNADVIAVVKAGVIIEQGKHEDLITNKDGAYSSLVRLHMSSK